MVWKSRWLYKGLSWKLLSLLLGALIVYWLTGTWAMSLDYAVIYFPSSLALFLIHEKLWHMWKLYQREKHGHHEIQDTEW